MAAGAVVVGAIAYDQVEKHDKEKRNKKYRGDCADPTNSRNHAQDKKLSEAEGKRIEAENLKGAVLGRGQQGAHYDIYKDRDGDLYVKPKGGNGPGEPVGKNIRDF